jgi:hypothetical protein
VWAERGLNKQQILHLLSTLPEGLGKILRHKYFKGKLWNVD